jgi:hypothetical protein
LYIVGAWFDGVRSIDRLTRVRLETAKEETLMCVRMCGAVTVVEESRRDESTRATDKLQEATNSARTTKRSIDRDCLVSTKTTSAR